MAIRINNEIAADKLMGMINSGKTDSIGELVIPVNVKYRKYTTNSGILYLYEIEDTATESIYRGFDTRGNVICAAMDLHDKYIVHYTHKTGTDVYGNDRRKIKSSKSSNRDK